MRCSACSYVIPESQLPRLPMGKLICPKCNTPNELPGLTMPYGQGALPTIQADRASGGSLVPHKKYSLIVLSGDKKGDVIPLEKARTTIGRIGCDIVLEDEELSRQHALLAINGTEARLEDLGSTNGTFVGSERIEHADLSDRSEFRVGSHQLLFVVSDRELTD